MSTYGVHVEDDEHRRGHNSFTAPTRPITLSSSGRLHRTAVPRPARRAAEGAGRPTARRSPATTSPLPLGRGRPRHRHCTTTAPTAARSTCARDGPCPVARSSSCWRWCSATPAQPPPPPPPPWCGPRSAPCPIASPANPLPHVIPPWRRGRRGAGWREHRLDRSRAVERTFDRERVGPLAERVGPRAG